MHLMARSTPQGWLVSGAGFAGPGDVAPAYSLTDVGHTCVCVCLSCFPPPSQLA